MLLQFIATHSKDHSIKQIIYIRVKKKNGEIKWLSHLHTSHHGFTLFNFPRPNLPGINITRVIIEGVVYCSPIGDPRAVEPLLSRMPLFTLHVPAQPLVSLKQ